MAKTVLPSMETPDPSECKMCQNPEPKEVPKVNTELESAELEDSCCTSCANDGPCDSELIDGELIDADPVDMNDVNIVETAETIGKEDKAKTSIESVVLATAEMLDAALTNLKVISSPILDIDADLVTVDIDINTTVELEITELEIEPFVSNEDIIESVQAGFSSKIQSLVERVRIDGQIQSLQDIDLTDFSNGTKSDLISYSTGDSITPVENFTDIEKTILSLGADSHAKRIENLQPDFRGIAAVSSLMTGDFRFIEKGALGKEPLPWFLLMKTEKNGQAGHIGSHLVGVISNAEIEVHENIDVMYIEGTFSNNEKGKEAKDLLNGGFIRAISVDMSEIDYDLKETVEGQEYISFSKAIIGGATLLYGEAAIKNAYIQVANDSLVASGAERVSTQVVFELEAFSKVESKA